MEVCTKQTIIKKFISLQNQLKLKSKFKLYCYKLDNIHI